MSSANEIVVAFALAIVTAACSARAAGPPDIAVDRTVCSHCGMLISEPIFAAAYQPHDGEPRVFDDIGCLLDAVRAEQTPPVQVWFQDAGGSGWLTAGHARFVTSKRARTPMNGGILAFASAAAADKAAAQHAGEVVLSFEALMTRKGMMK